MPLLKDLFLEAIQPKNYYKNSETGKYIITHNGKYYLTCNDEEQAQATVERLKKHHWDKTLVPIIKKELGLIKIGKNKTGFYRVYIAKDKNAQKGYNYTYEVQVDGIRTKLTSKKLSELRLKVKKHHLIWKPLNSDAEKIEEILERRSNI